jgi:hypothetical protein
MPSALRLASAAGYVSLVLAGALLGDTTNIQPDASAGKITAASYGAVAESSAGTPEAVRRYAPVVYLHPDDQDRPMSAHDFVAHSSLRWSHDGNCRDQAVAPEGRVDERKLGGGAYREQTRSNKISLPPCHAEGRLIRSNEKARPREDGVAGGEGFFLDLDDGARRGSGTAAPAYFVYEPHRFVSYFFLYGFNDSGRPPGNHEGDWEQISVRLDDHDRAIAMAYYAHGAPRELAWRQVPRVLGHPAVYSANGSHASYPSAGTFDRALPAILSGKDHTARGGPVWRTQGLLLDARTQPWYGYGGGWGQVGAKELSTGPTGPRSKQAPAGWIQG